jgi:hypothetical protein
MSTKLYNDHRFEQLAEKISRIQNLELKNPDLYTNLENRIVNLEVEYKRYLKDYEFKYTHLEDDIKIIFKMINSNKELREDLQSKYENEIKSFEIKLTAMFLKERESANEYTSNMFKNLETEYEKIKTLLNNDRERFKDNLGNLKQFINVEIPKYHTRMKELENEGKLKIDDLTRCLNEETSYLNSLVCYI